MSDLKSKNDGRMVPLTLLPLKVGSLVALHTQRLISECSVDVGETQKQQIMARVTVKWPNDVRSAQKKVSGILVETGGAGQNLWIAAGIGINVAFAPDNVGQAATSLADLSGQSLDLKQVTAEFQRAFERRLIEARTGFEAMRQDWLDHSEGKGERVAVRIGEGTIEGIFEDLESDGALRLRLPDGNVRIIRAGEVNLIGRV